MYWQVLFAQFVHAEFKSREVAGTAGIAQAPFEEAKEEGINVALGVNSKPGGGGILIIEAEVVDDGW